MFGSVSAYEAVTYLARNIMKKSYEIALKNGYKVINYIIDSLFLVPKDPKVSIDELSKIISNEVKINIRVEDRFIWLVFPYTRKCIGSAGRYYGLKDDGTFKIKGINAVRSNVPEIVKYAEMKALEALKCSNKEEFYMLLNKARQVYDNVKRSLINGDINGELLTINKNINRLNSNTQQVKASKYMYGISEKISYIIRDGNPIPVDFYDGRYDKKYYLSYLERSEIEMPWSFLDRICRDQ